MYRVYKAFFDVRFCPFFSSSVFVYTNNAFVVNSVSIEISKLSGVAVLIIGHEKWFIAIRVVTT